MIDPNGAYLFSRSGSYPNETYNFRLLEYNTSKINNLPATRQYKNTFRYINNPIAGIDKLLFDYNLPYITYVNCGPNHNDTLFYLLTSSTVNASTISWTPSNLRVYDTGYIFNYFAIQNINTQDIARETYTTKNNENLKNYSYLLRPSRFILNPVSVNINNGEYLVQTEVKLLSSSVSYFYDRESEYYAYLDIKNIENYTTPTFEPLPVTGSILYTLSAVKMVKNAGILSFGDFQNPYIYQTILPEFVGRSNIKIKPNSTYVTYKSELYTQFLKATYENIIVGQELTEHSPDLHRDLMSSFILNQNIQTEVGKNFQTFQLVQSGIDPNKELESANNCIQSLRLNLSSGTVTYSAYNINAYPILTGVDTIGLSYVAESSNFFVNRTLVDTVNAGISAITNPTKTWTLTYPPHNYSLKATYINATSQSYETATLNFYLSSGIVEKYISREQSSSTSVSSYSAFKIKNILISDYGYLTLPIETYATNDVISFKCIDAEELFVESLSCYYGPNFNVYYDLTTSPYVNAVSAKEIVIKYPKEKFGHIEINLMASLSTFYTTLDNKENLHLIFSEGKSTQIQGYPLSIEIINESENKITLSCGKLSSINIDPYKDLTNSNIRWSYTPSNLAITFASLDPDTLEPQLSTVGTSRIPYIVPPNTVIPFNTLTNTILVSGHGADEISIKLESIKYEEYDTVKTNPIYYDFLNDNKFTFLFSTVQNQGRTSTFTLSAKVKFGNQLFDIPQSLPLNWKWTYNSNDNPLTQPITAYKPDGSIYTYGDVLFPYEINSLKFIVDLDDGDNFLNTNELMVKVSSNYHNRLIFGEIPIYLNDYPNKNIFNVDFKTFYYTHSSVQIADTYNNINVITRPKEDVNIFTFKPDNNVISQIQAESISWIISSNTGTLSTVNYYTNNNISYEINNNTTTITTVTLSAHKASLAGWDILNNISSTTTIYTIPSSEFINDLQFLIYPPYTWEKNKNGYITILDNTNYTLAVAPSTYNNKKSKTQNFVVSANKQFDFYDYFYGQFLTYNDTLESLSGELELPYHDDLFIDTGSQISLIVYDEKYPRINGTSYTGVSGSNVLYNGQFPITAKTIPFSSVYINTISSFKQSPRIVDYPYLNLNYILNTSSIDLDNNITVKVAQDLSMLELTYSAISGFDLFDGIFDLATLNLSATNPIVQSNDLLDSFVTYKLSCKYWEYDIKASSLAGVYDLFILRVGDPSTPLTIRDSEITTLTLNSTASVLAKIPDTTFQYVSTSYILDDYNLWDDELQLISNDTISTIVAYSTSVKPKIYISSYYTITGESIKLEFETPENTFNFKITSYDVFFGDSLSATIYDDIPFYKQYELPGVYNLSYNVYYNDGSSKFFQLDIPINVYPTWTIYDQNKIRLLNELNLSFGNALEDTYDLNEIEIQPNEWGDVDIFNTAISRLNSNLNYLIYNAQTINTDSPTLFYGWLGNNTEKKSYGITWHTQSYNKEYVNAITNAVSLELESESIKKFSYFNTITDAIETKDRIYMLDGTKFRAFSSGKIPQEIIFENISEINSMLITPNSIYTNETGEDVYISDSFKNKIFKFNIDSESYPPQINLQLTVGNLGDKEDTNKFNSPSEMIYQDELVFVLDYNNKCIKQFTKDLNWMFTYYTDEFESDQPINIAIQPETLLIYVLTKSYKIYIFDYFKNSIFETIDVSFINDGNNIIKLFFNKNGDFFYILNDKNIYKYSASGSFISQVTIPNDQNIYYKSGKATDYSSIILCTDNSIIKFQDILSIFKIGQGLPSKYWTLDQLLLSNDDFPDDITYNRSLNRLVQNIKSFRDTLESRFVIVTEQTDSGVVEYFSLFPVSYQNRPIFSSNIENETLGVGVNEFHIPQVFNRELKYIYEALLSLKDFLDIRDVRVLSNKIDDINTGCLDGFCWSWKAMSCYNLSLPIIRICNTNPITYAELKSSFPSEYTYVPNNKNKYGDAISKCCSNVESPLNMII